MPLGVQCWINSAHSVLGGLCTRVPGEYTFLINCVSQMTRQNVTLIYVIRFNAHWYRIENTAKVPPVLVGRG